MVAQRLGIAERCGAAVMGNALLFIHSIPVASLVLGRVPVNRQRRRPGSLHYSGVLDFGDPRAPIICAIPFAKLVIRRQRVLHAGGKAEVRSAAESGHSLTTAEGSCEGEFGAIPNRGAV